MIRYTVSDINRFVKQILAAEDILHGIYIQGEISNFVHHLRSGHCYFTLKDQNSSIKCVLFRSYAERLSFVPENGMKVLVRGDVQVYERDGVYQVYCVDIQPDGVGALSVAYEQLKQKLAAEGLFEEERKRPLPKFPEKIGVITSKTGAALQDILNILGRRYSMATVCLFPVLVQGEEAPASICQAFQKAEEIRPDVIIVGRGGGSMEDLWAFNDESVARAIASCTIPVISAVGHEVDFTIADFVADLRAPTPSAAAELVSPDGTALRQNIDNLTEVLYNNIVKTVQNKEQILDHLELRLQSSTVFSQVQRMEEHLGHLENQMNHLFRSIFEEKKQAFLSAANLLDSLSPLNVLTRGYSITFHENGKVLRSVRRTKVGDTISVRLGDGTLSSVITEKELN